MPSAILLDVDFTLARPGPELGPIGYQRVGREHGLDLDTSRLEASVRRAFADAERHPELDHDEELWLRLTEAILRGMGGEGAGVTPCAAAITAAWQEVHHFELYDDVLPTLARFRRHGYRIALISNTARDLDLFVRHHQLDVDAALSSKVHGKMKPHASIFLAALELLGCIPAAAAMVGDSPEDDIAGARALGMRAFLLDRHDRYPDAEDRLRGLDELPAALGLPA
ncbi:MAG TPA: HAD-IA family hydrolase [Kofleriaceae bacterium]|nr:HAD-IA family hydrolase [Kofleriaceae bacterium]